MEQTVYLDIFFLINFSMDLLCFFITSRLLSHRLTLWRSAIAAVVGGAYACVALFTPLQGIWAFACDIAACLVMSFVAVKREGEIRETLGYAVVYAAVSALLGGAMTALFSLMNKLGVPELLGGESGSDGVSVWLFALLAALSGVLSLVGGRIWKRRSSRRFGRVEIAYGASVITLDALCDSGNLLAEPISAKPCIVVDRREVERILPQGVVRMINTGNGDRLSPRDIGRIRVVPTSTVNGGGMLYAVRFDRVRLDMGKGWCAVDAYVALSELEGVKALVPSALVGSAP